MVVIAPDELLDDQHGADYLAWELRGNRVCIERASAPSDPLPAGLELPVELDDDGAVVPVGGYLNGSAAATSDCPLIPDAARADPGAGG